MAETGSQVLEFIEFVEGQSGGSTRRLLSRILLKSRLITGAEAGTVFIVRGSAGRRRLEAISMQNDRVRVPQAGFTVPATTATIAGHVAATGESVRIADVYRIPDGCAYRFDPRNEVAGYRTRSMLAFPLKNHQDRVIGVVQLINRKVAGHAEPVEFDDGQVQLILPIARAIATKIETADMLDHIRERNQKLRLRNRELAQQRARIGLLQEETWDAFMMSIRLLAHAAEIHDEETGNHIVRVNEYSHFLARQLGMPDAFCEEIRFSAQMHDVGKMSINTAVLTKRGPLTATERAEMDRHPEYGWRILSASPKLALAAEIAYAHHEKWDGSGYPRRLAGAAIPVSARIVALADVYDALRSVRPYKPAFDHARSIDILLNGDDRIDPARHFDPALLAIVAERHAGLAEIYERLKD